MRQPFLKSMNEIPNPTFYPKVEFLHECGFFIGNNHMITSEEFSILEDLVRDWAHSKNPEELT